MNNNVLAGIAAIAVIGVGLALIAKPNAPITVNTNSPVSVETPAGQSFGAVPSLNSPLEINGTSQSLTGVSFRTGTSTVCSTKITATSTGAVIVRARTVPFETVFQIAVGATSNATTTNLGAISVGSTGETGIAVSTTTDGQFGTLLYPNQWLIVKTATSTGTTVDANFAPTGDCQFYLTNV